MNVHISFYIQAMSANSSQTDLYAVVDKVKKTSTPAFHTTSTRPIRKHEYEHINDDDLPPKLPPPYQPNGKHNDHAPPKPAPYHSNNKDIKKTNDSHSVSSSGNRYLVGFY